MDEENAVARIDPKSQAATVVKAAGFEIGLDHVMIMGGKLYVTHNGLLWKLNDVTMREQLDGFTCEPIIELCNLEKDQWVYRAELWLKGNSKPFTGFGHARPENVSKIVRTKGRCNEMAQTRAESRAMRKALRITFPTYEEAMVEQQEQIIEVKDIVVTSTNVTPKVLAPTTPMQQHPTDTPAEPTNGVTEFIRLRDLGIAKGIFKLDAFNLSIQQKIDPTGNTNPAKFTEEQLSRALVLIKSAVDKKTNKIVEAQSDNSNNNESSDKAENISELKKEIDNLFLKLNWGIRLQKRQTKGVTNKMELNELTLTELKKLKNHLELEVSHPTTVNAE